MKKSQGFTLIELMIVVAIIGILSAIAIPKFADLIRKSNEGTTKGNISALKSAFSIYYAEMEGWFPTANPGPILTMDNGKYIKDIPLCYAPPYHARTANFTIIPESAVGAPGDTGEWGYRDERVTPVNKPWGEVWINCTETDSKGVMWGYY